MEGGNRGTYDNGGESIGINISAVWQSENTYHQSASLYYSLCGK